jgi:hypothetical protein
MGKLMEVEEEPENKISVPLSSLRDLKGLGPILAHRSITVSFATGILAPPLFDATHVGCINEMNIYFK